jgi:GNAT superfamily N-acetyltransferase
MNMNETGERSGTRRKRRTEPAMSSKKPDSPGKTPGEASIRRTGIVIDPRCGNHRMEADAPECPARLDVLQAMLREPAMRNRFVEIPARPAGRQALAEVHAPAYIKRLEATAAQPCVYFDEDTSTSPGSHEAALLAAGGLCLAIGRVDAGELDNAFALVRPPGHHAERDAARGFCLYNNVAVGARFAQRELGLGRVLIVDWDLHHGNGTQNCFADDPSVLFFSTHKAFAWVTFRDFKLALWYTLTLAPGECYLVYIFVHPYFVGRGVGTYLLGKLMREMRDLGAVRMISGMYRNWEVSFGLHTKMGFRIRRTLSQCRLLNILPTPPKEV